MRLLNAASCGPYAAAPEMTAERQLRARLPWLSGEGCLCELHGDTLEYQRRRPIRQASIRGAAISLSVVGRRMSRGPTGPSPAPWDRGWRYRWGG